MQTSNHQGRGEEANQESLPEMDTEPILKGKVSSRQEEVEKGQATRETPSSCQLVRVKQCGEPALSFRFLQSNEVRQLCTSLTEPIKKKNEKLLSPDVEEQTL